MSVLGQAAGLGLATGIRSMMGLRMLAASARSGAFDDRDSRLVRALRSRTALTVLNVLAAGELVVDKLPGIPSRLAPVPLGARLLLGALVGGAVGAYGANRRTCVAGALIGAAAAVTAAFAGNRARAWLQKRTKLADPIAALVEDGIAMSLGSATKPA